MLRHDLVCACQPDPCGRRSRVRQPTSRANLTVGQVARFAEALDAMLRVELVALEPTEPLLAHMSGRAT